MSGEDPFDEATMTDDHDDREAEPEPAEPVGAKA
jgi:hypothetical protein